MIFHCVPLFSYHLKKKTEMEIECVCVRSTVFFNQCSPSSSVNLKKKTRKKKQKQKDNRKMRINHISYTHFVAGFFFASHYEINYAWPIAHKRCYKQNSITPKLAENR